MNVSLLRRFTSVFVQPASACAISAALVLGCGGDKPKSSGTAKPAAGAAHHDEHDHATAGPHGGALIELGDEEYHAELIHDDKAATVTVYLLDSSAKKAVPVATTELVINLTAAGKPAQFKVAAKPEATDGAGRSSRFASTEAALVAGLDDEKADAQLVVTIDGKPYRGKIAHAH